MIKDVFKLKKDSWHAKLMKYTWGLDHSDFSHICPYFHLTWLNCILFIPLFIVKTVINLILMPLFARINKYRLSFFHFKKEKKFKKLIKEQEKAKKRAEEIKKDQNKLKDYILKIELNYQLGICIPKEYKELRNHIVIDWSKWDKIIQPEVAKYINEKNKKEENQEKKLKEKQLENKNKINNILKIWKPLGKFLAIFGSILLFATALIILYKLTLLTSKVWREVVLILVLLLILILVALLIAFLIKTLSNVFKNIELPCWLKSIVKSTAASLYKYTIYPIVWLFRGIKTIFQIAFQIIKNNCPAINWE